LNMVSYQYAIRAHRTTALSRQRDGMVTERSTTARKAQAGQFVIVHALRPPSASPPG
jgi:hypothetical protein